MILPSLLHLAAVILAGKIQAQASSLCVTHVLFSVVSLFQSLKSIFDTPAVYAVVA